MKRILTAALVLLLAAAPLAAQKKAETKLYERTLSKPSVGWCPCSTTTRCTTNGGTHRRPAAAR